MREEELTVDDLLVTGHPEGAIPGRMATQSLREWLACSECGGSGQQAALNFKGEERCKACGGSGLDPDKVREWCLTHDDTPGSRCYFGSNKSYHCKTGWVVLVTIGGNDDH